MRPAEPAALPGVLDAREVADTAAWIAAVQRPSGAIPWYPGGHVDPWDHVECAMALAATGRLDGARAAYAWLRATQRTDGSWPTRVRGPVVEDATTDLNHCAYLAVGIWHYLLTTGDLAFVARMWPTVRRAIALILSVQTGRGEIPWACDAAGRPADEALLTGCASMHQALWCAIALAERLERPQPGWEAAASRLGHVVAAHEDAFGDRSRFSMDWYYPVLGGAVRGGAAHARIAQRWDTFVVPGLGARCVSDQPWVTGAETCELALTLHAIGRGDDALALLASTRRLRERDGSYWTGYQFANDDLWPVEHSTWTAAAVLLTVDALTGASGGAALFSDPCVPPTVAGISTCARTCDEQAAG